MSSRLVLEKKDSSSLRRLVRNFFLEDLNIEEKRSYNSYIKGDQNSTLWIEKVNNKRDMLLNIRCSMCAANQETKYDISCFININEFGRCICGNGHECYDEILEKIDDLQMLESGFDFRMEPLN